MQTQVKHWYRSKSIGVGAIGVLIAALGAYIEGHDWKLAVLAGLSAAMIALRTVTKEGVSL